MAISDAVAIIAIFAAFIMSYEMGRSYERNKTKR